MSIFSTNVAGRNSASGINTLVPNYDVDSTNELQSLSLNGDTLSISGGNDVLLNNSSELNSNLFRFIN